MQARCYHGTWELKPVGCDQQRHVGFANCDVARENTSLKTSAKHRVGQTRITHDATCALISGRGALLPRPASITLLLIGESTSSCRVGTYFWCLDSESPPLPRDNFARKPPRGLVVTFLIPAAARPPPRED